MKHRAVLIPLIIVFQFALNTLISAAWIVPANAQIIPAGITISGKAIGGMTRSQAVAYLEKDNSNSLIKLTLILQDGPKHWTLTTGNFNFHYDYGKTIDSALTSPPSYSGTARFLKAMKLQAQSQDVPVQISWDEQKLRDWLLSINKEIMLPARDAKVDYQRGRFLIEQEQVGEGLDVSTTTTRIMQSVLAGQEGTLAIVKQPLAPSITSRDLEGINCQLAVFSSKLTYLAHRSTNIILAARALDGAVIMPGQTFSFNQRVGQRTTDKGYKDAPIITGNTLKDDVGGGVCQVASTLYNAALLAGLEVVEHSGHSLPVKYVPSGKDATVYYDLIDLKLKNNRNNPIVISSKVENNTLLVYLLGNSGNKK
ncbi:MAG TPA: VanW family protein [Syntrophomonadaceae bacterium]|nr:VanW family protein [Syntrophomonadaceae bacterium]